MILHHEEYVPQIQLPLRLLEKANFCKSLASQERFLSPINLLPTTSLGGASFMAS